MNIKDMITRSLRQNTADQEELLQQILTKAQRPARTHLARRLAAVALCGALVAGGVSIAMHNNLVPGVAVTAGPVENEIVHEITLIQFNANQEDGTQTSQKFLPGTEIKLGEAKISKDPLLNGGGYALVFSGGLNAIRVQADGLQSVTFSCDEGVMRYFNVGVMERYMNNISLQVKADLNADEIASMDVTEMNQLFDEYLMTHNAQEAAPYFTNGHLSEGYTYSYSTDHMQSPVVFRIEIRPAERAKQNIFGQSITIDASTLSKWDEGAFSASWQPSREMYDRLMQDDAFSYADDWGTHRITITCHFSDGSSVDKFLDARFDEEGNMILKLLADA